MSEHISESHFRKTLLVLLLETFEKVEGIYLDGGTSLFETLASLDARQASRPLINGGTTVAAHTEHIRFYLQVLEDYMQGKKQERIDWNSSWKTRTVSEKEWKDLTERLREKYLRISEYVKSQEDWNDEKKIGGALGIVIHTAYHLGAIRQLLRVVKA